MNSFFAIFISEIFWYNFCCPDQFWLYYVISKHVIVVWDHFQAFLAHFWHFPSCLDNMFCPTQFSGHFTSFYFVSLLFCEHYWVFWLLYCYLIQAAVCVNCLGDKYLSLSNLMSTALTQLLIFRFSYLLTNKMGSATYW